MRRTEYLHETLQDIRHGLRQMRRQPAFASAVILTLAVGIGATTAVFSTADHVLLRPLPYAEAGRVVTLWETDQRTGTRREVAPGNFLAWKERNTTFERMGIAEPWASDLIRSDGPPEELPVWRVSEGFLEGLGATVVLGRAFVDEEFEGTAFSDAATGVIRDHSGTGRSVLISDEMWRSRYGEDPAVIGRPIEIDGVARTVVGVLSSGVEYPETRPLWMPKLFSDLERVERTGGFMSVVGRLRPGVTLAQAQADMDRVAAGLAADYPGSSADTGVLLVPLAEEVLGDVRPALLLLLGAVAFVLAVACANVAGLMLVRGSTRRREVAVRVALGAGRVRLVRQLITENLVVGLMGGVGGILLAGIALRALSAFGPADLPRIDTIELDARVLAFAVLTTLLTALLAGLFPALRASNPRDARALRTGDRSSSSGQDGMKARNVLVVAEVAVVLALTIGAGLLGRSFVSLLQSDLGFETENRATLLAFLWDRNTTPESRIQRASEIMAGMEAVAGVERVAIASSLPFNRFGTYLPLPVAVVDRPPLPDGQQLEAQPNNTSPEYFEVMSIPLLEGRRFSPSDRADAPPVAIINETMARTFFPDEDPIGKKVTVVTGRTVQAGREMEVVGVVGDVRQTSIVGAPNPEIFIPFAQNAWGGVMFVAQTRTDAAALLPRLREVIWEVDPGQAIYHTSTMEAQVGDTLGARRFSLLLLTSFALIGIVLVAIGIFGSISYSTSRRTHEIGIRMALGSTRSEVVFMILRQGLRIGLLGVGAGVVLSLVLTRFMDHMLYAVRPTDPGTFVALAVFMLLLSVAASWVPARRGARLEPVQALREV